MGQIDYFFRWLSLAEAKQDALLLANHVGMSDGVSPDVRDWLRNYVLPNVQVWRPSQDIVTVSPATRTHVYLSGWSAIISWPSRVALLLNASALAFALDRDACNAGQPFVIKNNVGAIINDIGVSPVFAGSNYPIGGYPASISPDV